MTDDAIRNYPELAALVSDWPKFLQPILNAQTLSGKQIVVTGAGDGIGKALAKTLACLGANVILLGRTRSKLETVFDWINQHTNTDPVIVPCDLARLDGTTVATLAESIRSHYGSLHGLVHNASMLGPKVPIAHYPAEQWQAVMQTNVNAVFMLNQGLFELLDSSDHSCVIHVSSTVGQQGRAYWGAYSASKFALEGLSQILADETETAGKIRVYSINPGGTRTGMRREAYPLEDPTTLPTPEQHMSLFVFLLAGSLLPGSIARELPTTGTQLDARNWQE